MRIIIALIFFMSIIVVPATFAAPNIVLILVDDLGWNDLSCTGSTYYETPNIDKLANEGARFTQAYAACAVCSPTRAAVLTGRYPARMGITDWIRPPHQRIGNSPDTQPDPSDYIAWEDRLLETPSNVRNLPSSELTLAEVLKGAGYTTAFVGKWHLGDEGSYPEDHGFDYNFGGCSFGQPPDYFDPYTNAAAGGIPSLPPRKTGEYLTDREADEARKFILMQKTSPFFLLYAPYAVHSPLQAKEELVRKYKEKSEAAQGKAEYAAMIESLDDAVGVILETLKEENLLGNTLVFFTSDNGGVEFATDNSPLRRGKGYPWEGGLRVPTMAYWPGTIPAGKQVHEPFISMDIFPTLCMAVGQKHPVTKIDGISFWETLTEDSALPPRDAIIWHFPHYRQNDVTPYSIIREGNFKLIYYYDGASPELYDLENDLKEIHNLALEKPETVAELTEKLKQKLSEIKAKIPRKKAT